MMILENVKEVGPAAVGSKLDARSRYLRRLIVTALDGGGRGHVGSALSLIEIIRVLYDDIVKFSSEDPGMELRDRVILSKGHGCLALYAVLADKGYISKDCLKEFCTMDAVLGGHPEDKVPGVEASTGSLGHGLSIGVGIAIATRMKRLPSYTYVIMGDGEINEGSVWEAAMAASKHQLDRLVAIIDYNKLQSYGSTSEVLELEPLVDKWESFGFDVCEVDGHGIDELRQALSKEKLVAGKPKAVICHTVKGKGLPFAENNLGWHHKSKLRAEEIQHMYEALGK